MLSQSIREGNFLFQLRRSNQRRSTDNVHILQRMYCRFHVHRSSVELGGKRFGRLTREFSPDERLPNVAKMGFLGFFQEFSWMVTIATAIFR